MKFITAKKDAQIFVGLVDSAQKQVVDLNSLGFPYADMNALIAGLSAADQQKLAALAANGFSGCANVFPLSQLCLLAPIPRPLHDVICLGLNYAEHIAETGLEKTEEPMYFSKRAAITTGHMGTVDGNFSVDSSLDYESELAVIIGKHCRNVRAENAQDVIFGYTVFNDFSARTLQRKRKQFFLGKSGDGFCAMGPWIVTDDEISFPPELQNICRINGELRQSSNTRYMLHSIPAIIADITRSITLEPGDIIATGTPSGVGLRFNPPKFLKSGDTVECEIEKIGILQTTIK